LTLLVVTFNVVPSSADTNPEVAHRNARLQMVGKGRKPWVIAKQIAFGDEQPNKDLQCCLRMIKDHDSGLGCSFWMSKSVMSPGIIVIGNELS
jgi:hypothetical protein